MKEWLQQIYNIYISSVKVYEICDSKQLGLTERSIFRDAGVALHQDETVSCIDRTKNELGALYCTVVCGDQCE